MWISLIARLGLPRRVKIRGLKINMRIWRNWQFPIERRRWRKKRKEEMRRGRIFQAHQAKEKFGNRKSYAGAYVPNNNLIYADMAELADALDSGTNAREAF